MKFIIFKLLFSFLFCKVQWIIDDVNKGLNGMEAQNTNIGGEPRQLKLVGAALLLGIGFNVLFYDHAIGMSYPLFTAMYLGLLFLSLKGRLTIRVDFGLFLLISVSLLAMTFMLFDNPVLKALNIIAVPMLLAMFAEHALGLRTEPWGWQRIGTALGRLTFRTLGFMPMAFRIPFLTLRRNGGAKRFQTGVKIAAGLLLSLPVIMISVTLLSSADKLFEQSLQHIPNWFQNESVVELLGRGFLILLATSYLFGLTWSLIRDADRLGQSNKEGPVQGPHRAPFRFDPIITATLLTSVNAVYLLFTVIQFVYLFGGGQGLLPDGMTYAEYARRGFGEVVVVTVINFGVMLGVLQTTSIDKPISRVIVRPLLMLLIANTAVLLISAYVRLDLYEAAYGYTYLRLFVHAFLLWMGAMLVLMLIKIIRPAKPLLRTAFILSVLALVLLNYFNTDAVIAKRNLERYVTTGQVDWDYLNNLSYDAVPALVSFNKVLGSIPELETGLIRKHDRLERYDSWQSFHIGKYRAKLALEQQHAASR
jgi:hypothetical protein